MHTLRIFVHDLQFFPIRLPALLIYVLPKIENQTVHIKSHAGIIIIKKRLVKKNKEFIVQKEELNTDASYASAASARSSARSKSTSITAIRRATWTHI